MLRRWYRLELKDGKKKNRKRQPCEQLEQAVGKLDEADFVVSNFSKSSALIPKMCRTAIKDTAKVMDVGFQVNRALWKSKATAKTTLMKNILTVKKTGKYVERRWFMLSTTKGFLGNLRVCV